MPHVFIILIGPGMDLPRHSPFAAFSGPGAVIYFDPPHPSPDERVVMESLTLEGLERRMPGQYRYRDDHRSFQDLLAPLPEIRTERLATHGGPPPPWRKNHPPPPRKLGGKGRR